MPSSPSDPASRPADFQLRDLTLSVYLPTFLFAVGIGAVTPVIPLLARDLGAGDGLVGGVVAMRAIGTTMLDVPAGVASAHFGHRPTIGVAGIALVAAGVAGFLSDGAAALAIAVLIIGAGSALFMTARLAFMAERVPLRRRGRALSLIGGTHRIGLFAGPVLGGFIGLQWGLGATFVLQAGACASSVALVIAFMPDSRITTPLEPDVSIYRRVGRTVVQHRRTFGTAGSVMVALALLRGAREILIPLRGDDIGLDVAQIGIIFGVGSAIDMTFFYPVGVVMDRFGRKWSAVPSILVLAVALALVPMADSLGWLLVVGLLAGVGNGLGSGINMTLGTDLAPRDRPSEFLGAWRLMGDLGRVASPFAIGFVTQAATLSAAAFMVGGVGLLGAGIMIVFVRETLRLPVGDPSSRDRSRTRDPIPRADDEPRSAPDTHTRPKRE